MDRQTAERCTILRGLVGSTVHGLNVNDGIEDRDEMGICVEPLDDAMALWDPFEQFIYRTAAEREEIVFNLGEHTGNVWMTQLPAESH